MKVTVRYFALYRERAGASQSSYHLPKGATVSDLIGEVRERHPDLAPLHVSIVAAVNTEYAGADTVLEDGDEVALIPPVSGGK